MEMNTIDFLSYYFNMIWAYFVFFFTYLYENFREFALIIKIAAVSLTISVSIILVCLIRLIYKSWKRRRWERVMSRLEERYGEGITYILSSEAKPNMSRNEVLEVLDISPSDSNSKELLKNQMEQLQFCRLLYGIRISENAALNRGRNLNVLLSLFGVKEFLEEVINVERVKLKVEALQMMRAFKIAVNPWIVNQLRNSKRNRVRRLSMYASIMSNSNSDLEYFESEFFDNNCCIYDEIQLGYVLRRRQSAKRKIPNLAHWAYLQKNENTQCVFVRLMRQFNQREYCADLVDLLNNTTDRDLIEEIARTWGYLSYNESEEILGELLPTQPDDTKVAIMHALTRMGTGKSIGALVDGYRNSGDSHVRLEALRCLYNYGDAGKSKFKELEMSADEKERALFAFFYNPLTVNHVELGDSDEYTPLFGETIYSVV